MMFRVLEHYNDIDALRPFIFEKANNSYVNDGPFIKQSLRSHFQSEKTRRAAIAAAVEKIMETAPNYLDLEGANVATLPSIHPRLLTESGKKGAFGIFHDGAQSGTILYGPYIKIEAGDFSAMIDLRIIYIAGDQTDALAIDIVADHGRRQIFNGRQTFTELGYHSLGFGFTAEGGAENLEIRVHAPVGVEFYIIGVRLTRTG